MSLPSLKEIDEIDKKWSEKVHEWDTLYFELIFFISGMAFSPFVIPFMPFTIYLMSLLYFRSDADMATGSDLFHKSAAYALIHTAWLLVAFLTTILMKKFIYRERPEGRNSNRLLNLRWNEHNGAFPSGDTLQAALYCGFLFLNYSCTGIVFLLQVRVV